MYQFAYPVIADEPVSHPSLTYSQMLSLALELIDAADRADSAGHERLAALSNFRRFWISIADDLSRAAGVHAGPGHLAALATLSQDVISGIEIRRMRASKEPGLRGRWLS